MIAQKTDLNQLPNELMPSFQELKVMKYLQQAAGVEVGVGTTIGPAT